MILRNMEQGWTGEERRDGEPAARDRTLITE